MEGSIVAVVYASAIKEFPDDLDFRIELVTIVHEYSGMEKLLDTMYASIKADFGGTAACCSVLANRYVLETGECNEATFEQGRAVFEDSMSSALTPELSEAYSKWLLLHLKSSTDKVGAADRLKTLFSASEAVGQMTASLWDDWVALLIREGSMGAAEGVVDRALEACPDSSSLWQHWFAVHLCKGGMAVGLSNAADAASEALVSATLLQPAVLQRLVHSIILCDSCDAKLTEWSHSLPHALTQLDSKSQWLQEAVLMWAMTWMERGAIRKLYSKLIQKSSTGLPLFKTCIDYERTHSKADADVRKLFERAVQLHGQNSDELWLAYIMYSHDMGNSSEVGRLFFRASKMLRDPNGIAQLQASVAALK